MSSVNVTIALPAELHRKMKTHDEISWSAAIRNMIEEKLRDIELLDKLTKQSKLSETDIEELSAKIDKKVAEKLGII